MFDKYFIMHQIRYSKLEELFVENKIDIPHSQCNLFINFESMLIKMCTPSVNEYIEVAEKGNAHIEFAAHVLNLIAHYRLFFTKHGIKSKIYLYYQSPDNKRQYNQNYNPDYRKHYISKFTNGSVNFMLMDVVVNAFPMIKLIAEYIEGVYIIDPCGVETSLVPLTVINNTNDNKSTNLIISSYRYDIQYVNYGFSVIVPKSNDSVILTKSNIESDSSYIKGVDFKGIPMSLYPFILAISGDTIRNIYGIKGIGLKRAVNMVRTALQNGFITENIDNVNLLIQLVKERYRQHVRTNYQCVNISSQYNDMSPGAVYQIMEQIVDKFDNESLKEINDTYFVWNPIRLIELTSEPRSRKNIKF